MGAAADGSVRGDGGAGVGGGGGSRGITIPKPSRSPGWSCFPSRAPSEQLDVCEMVNVLYSSR